MTVFGLGIIICPRSTIRASRHACMMHDFIKKLVLKTVLALASSCGGFHHG